MLGRVIRFFTENWTLKLAAVALAGVVADHSAIYAALRRELRAALPNTRTGDHEKSSGR